MKIEKDGSSQAVLSGSGRLYVSRPEDFGRSAVHLLLLDRHLGSKPEALAIVLPLLPPSHSLQPNLLFCQMSISIRRRTLTALLSVPPMAEHRCDERFETDLATSLINPRRIFDRQRRDLTVLVPVELSSIDLRSPFEHTDAVSEHGELPCRCPSPRCTASCKSSRLRR